MNREQVRNILESQNVCALKYLINKGYDLNEFHGLGNWKYNLLIRYCHDLHYYDDLNFCSDVPIMKAIRTLLAFRKNLDLNIMDDFGECKNRFTALDWAAFSENVEVVHLLLQSGAITNKALRYTQKPEIQKMLLAVGADPFLTPSHPRKILNSTKHAVREWLKSLESAEIELMKIFEENQMLVQEIKDFIYTENFLKAALL